MTLVWLLIIPLVGALISLLIPTTAVRAFAVAVSIIEFIVFIVLLGHPQTYNVAWIPEWGIRFHLGSDGLSLFLLGLTALLFPFAIAVSPKNQGRTYYFWLLFLEFGSMGLFSTLDLFFFYVFWEVILIPIFFILTGWGGENGRIAALKWLVMNLVGSVFMLLGIIALAVIHKQHLGSLTFELSRLTHLGLSPVVGGWLFLSFFVAFAIKAPMWPFHGWMPDSYQDAPAPVTALLSGLLSKAGLYGMLRILLPIFGPELIRFQAPLMLLSAVGLVYGAFMALRIRDMKLITAYSSLSHIGMMALGIFSLTRAGIMGATFQMVAHGVIVAGLFIVIGWIEDKTHTRDIKAMRGLNSEAPRLAVYFLLFSLAALGLPGLPGFAGEFMIIQGLIVHQVLYAVLAAIILVVAAWYMLRLFQGVMQGPSGANRITDLQVKQVAWIVPLSAVVVVLGIWPAGITTPISHTLFHVIHLSLIKGGGV